MTVIRFNPEHAAMNSLVQGRRQQARARATAKAARAVRDVLAGLAPRDAEAAALALLEAAAEAVAATHDPARTQAALGALAHRFGKQIDGPKAGVRQAADRMFRRA